MRFEMFSEETAWFCKIALSTTILSLRELFRRIKTPSTIPCFLYNPVIYDGIFLCRDFTQ